MQMSHSRVECFHSCPLKFKLRYLDELKTIPDDKPDNALYLGTALHTGLEIGVEEAIQQYYSNYPVITDEHINEAIKLEVMIPKAKQMIPKGQNEVLIETPDFKGFIDLLVPVESNGGIDVFDVYDFKYSNNKQNYLESDQLHLYKYFFEKMNPLCTIRNMYFLMVPKSKCKQFKGEELVAYRQRLLADLDTLTPELVQIQYDPHKVIRFLLQTKGLLEAEDYPMKKGFLCRYCDYNEFCNKGVDFMILPENKRRNLESTSKKVIWIYGSPFSGKTTFANHFPDPLMLNTDGNIKFVDAPYIHIKDKVEGDRFVKRTFAWEIFKDIITELEKKNNAFKTIVVDLLEDLYEFCRLYVYDQMNITHESDDMRSWDRVTVEFLSTLKRLMVLDYENIILISHEDSTKDIMKRGGDKLTAIKPNLRDKVSNKVSGMVDIVARTIADDGNYTLSFKRNEVIFGGGRLKFKAQEIPLDYKAFCELYAEANGNIAPVQVEVSHTPSSVEKVPSEVTKEEEPVTSEEIPVVSTENATPVVDNETAPVRRRKRRTE